MKIAIVLPHHFYFCAKKPNSIETVVRTLNMPLLPEHEIIVICGEGAEKDCNLKTHRIITKDKKLYRKQAAQFIIDFKPDLIEVHQAPKLASEIAKNTKIPTVLYRHNPAKKRKGFDKFLSKLEFSPLKAIIFVSDAGKNDFIKQYPNFANRAYSVKNPIDLNKWPEVNVPKENILFFAGRANPEKGIAELCDGLKLALKEFTDWRAIILLSEFESFGDWTTEQVKKLDEFGERALILRNQPMAKVIEYQSAAKIALIPSKFQEGFPLVALEAHALSCAIITAGTGGGHEVSGDNAIYLPEVSGQAIYNSIKSLISNPEKLSNLMEIGRDLVAREHNVSKRVSELMAVRQRVLDAKN